MKHQLAEITINYKPKIKASNRISISNAQDALKAFKEVWNDKLDYQESMYLLFLNRANHVLGFNLLAIGSSTGIIVDLRMILQSALKANAHSVIIAHNHPSGNCSPSNEDNRLTTKVKNGLNAIDIKLLDHLIITSDSYYSYADENNNAL